MFLIGSGWWEGDGVGRRRCCRVVPSLSGSFAGLEGEGGGDLAKEELRRPVQDVEVPRELVRARAGFVRAAGKCQGPAGAGARA